MADAKVRPAIPPARSRARSSMGDLLPLDGDDIDLRDPVWVEEPRSAAAKIEPVVQPLAAHRSTYARVIKPLGDRLLALMLVILLAPLMLAIAVGVRITLG